MGGKIGINTIDTDYYYGVKGERVIIFCDDWKVARDKMQNYAKQFWRIADKCGSYSNARCLVEYSTAEWATDRYVDLAAKVEETICIVN